MNIQAKKLNLIEWLVSLQDEKIINTIYHFREELLHKPVKKMTMDELVAEIVSSENDRKEGRVISLEDLEKESENW